MKKVKLSVTLSAKPKAIFKAWLNSKEPALFTKSEAKIPNKVGEVFTACGGYISGANMELIEGKKIVQAWRTTDFSDKDADSLLELSFMEKNEKTVLTLKHSNIPAGQGESYRNAWKDYSFKPMKAYFSEKS